MLNSLIKTTVLKSVKLWVFDMQKYRYSDRTLNELNTDIDFLILEIKNTFPVSVRPLSFIWYIQE